MWKAITVAVVAVGAVTVAADAQEHYVDASNVVRVLQTGTIAERYSVVSRVVEVGAIKRSPELAKAIGAELVRMNSVVAQRQTDLAEGRTDPAAPDIGEYLGVLVQACAQSNDPAVVEGLAGAIGSGNMATRALARFGSRALDRVAAIATGAGRFPDVVGALRTLTQMNETAMLSAEDRQRVTAIARMRLEGSQYYYVAVEAIELARSLGCWADLESIASGTLPTIIDLPERAWELRGKASAALASRK